VISKLLGAGNEECQLALEMNSYRIKKFIVSYTAVMDGLDAIIFLLESEKILLVCERLVCADMDYFGIHLDEAKTRYDQKNAK
jgi:acetate kinase